MAEHEVTTSGLQFLWMWAQSQPETKASLLIGLLVVTTLRDRGETLTKTQRRFLTDAEAAPPKDPPAP